MRPPREGRMAPRVQGQLRRLYVPHPPLSSAFSPALSGLLHIDFGRRFHERAPGAPRAVEMVEFARLPAPRQLGGMGLADGVEIVEARKPLGKARRVHDRRHARKLLQERIAVPPFGLLPRREMGALAIEPVMGGKAGLGAAAMGRWTGGKRRVARAIMRRETVPRLPRETGARRRGGLAFPQADGPGAGAVVHGGPRDS